MSAAENMDVAVRLCGVGGVQAAWGVKPDGTVFFAAKSGAFAALAEGAGVRVTWGSVQASGIVTQVRWLLANGNLNHGMMNRKTGRSLGTPDPPLAPQRQRRHDPRRVDQSHEPTQSSAMVGASGRDPHARPGLHPRRSFVGDDEDDTATLDRANDDDCTSYIIARRQNRVPQVHRRRP